MDTPAWSTHHLAEFLAALSSCKTEHEAVAVGVQRVAESFDAEICAYLDGTGVAAAVGFPAGGVPTSALLGVAHDDRSTLTLPDIGRCTVLSVPVAADDGTSIVVGRLDEAISPTESILLRSMARVLGLTLQMLGALDAERELREQQTAQAQENQRLLASLQERQSLLERLSGVQRAILLQAPLRSVLQLVTDGAALVLEQPVVGLRAPDSGDPGSTLLVSSPDFPPWLADTVQQTAIDDGPGGQAVLLGKMVVSELTGRPWGPDGEPGAVLAAPIRESGATVGCLFVAAASGKLFTARDREVLSAFADHASLALTDARTRHGMHRALDDALHQALHDPLTGLPNRSLFVDRLTQALARARRHDGSVAVYFVDLDNFKFVNDSSGHATGDELLQAVADRITGAFRAVDTVARFGGDEFAVVVEDAVDADHAGAAAERLLKAFADPFPLGDNQVSATASIGVVLGHPEAQADELLLNADVAMYHAKALGKGRWSLFRPEMHTSLLERIELEATLRAALEQDQFHLVYQPIVELVSGRTLGVEALLRWSHPTRGTLAPGEFIPLAEETGLVMDIGRWVLEQACRDVRDWRVPGSAGRPLNLTVNVSARQMQDATLVAHLREVLGESGFDAARLTLEITESVLIDRADTAGRRLAELKALGARLALDDFGTGYSSLSYLRRFPFDVVKIDKSFIDGLVHDAGDAKLVEAIVDLSRALSLETVAEGVETEEQRRRLIAMGCELAQGFHFAYPLPAAELERCLHAAVDAPAGRPAGDRT